MFKEVEHFYKGFKKYYLYLYLNMEFSPILNKFMYYLNLTIFKVKLY